MKNVLVSLAVMLFGAFVTLPAQAFNAYQDSTYLGIMPDIQCSTGLSCARVGSKLRMLGSVAGVKIPQVAATATTLTAAQCGSSFANSGAVEVELPDADAILGCRYTFITMNASNFDLDPDAADQIFALTNAAGDSLRNATKGNSVTLEAVAGGWAAVAIYGTWADNN